MSPKTAWWIVGVLWLVVFFNAIGVFNILWDVLLVTVATTFVVFLLSAVAAIRKDERK